MKKYLVTGGAGFIGSNIAFTLENAGNKVSILDNFSSGHFKNLLGFKGDIVAADLNDITWFDTLDGEYEAIFHEAAITDTTVVDQKKMMEVNVEGFRNVLFFALENNIKHIVYASSAGVYGNGVCPMSEENTPKPENVYGFSKAIMDNVARDFVKAHPEVTVVGLRYFNVFGPREYYKGHAASMMFQLYNQMKAGKRPRIFRAGEQMRDFVYVKDVVRANLLAAQSKVSGVFNVATGKPENFNRVVECLNKAMHLKLEPEYFENPYPFFQNKTQAQPDAALKNIGYKAEYTLDKGIEDYVAILEGGIK